MSDFRPKFPTLHTRRTCGSCGIKLRPHEEKHCLRCLTGDAFYRAAAEFAAANPRQRRPRRWAR